MTTLFLAVTPAQGPLRATSEFLDSGTSSFLWCPQSPRPLDRSPSPSLLRDIHPTEPSPLSWDLFGKSSDPLLGRRTSLPHLLDWAGSGVPGRPLALQSWSRSEQDVRPPSLLDGVPQRVELVGQLQSARGTPKERAQETQRLEKALELSQIKCELLDLRQKQLKSSLVCLQWQRRELESSRRQEQQQDRELHSKILHLQAEVSKVKLCLDRMSQKPLFVEDPEEKPGPGDQGQEWNSDASEALGEGEGLLEGPRASTPHKSFDVMLLQEELAIIKEENEQLSLELSQSRRRLRTCLDQLHQLQAEKRLSHGWAQVLEAERTQLVGENVALLTVFQGPGGRAELRPASWQNGQCRRYPQFQKGPTTPQMGQAWETSCPKTHWEVAQYWKARWRQVANELKSKEEELEGVQRQRRHELCKIPWVQELLTGEEEGLVDPMDRAKETSELGGMQLVKMYQRLSSGEEPAEGPGAGRCSAGPGDPEAQDGLGPDPSDGAGGLQAAVRRGAEPVPVPAGPAPGPAEWERVPEVGAPTGGAGSRTVPPSGASAPPAGPARVPLRKPPGPGAAAALSGKCPGSPGSRSARARLGGGGPGAAAGGGEPEAGLGAGTVEPPLGAAGAAGAEAEAEEARGAQGLNPHGPGLRRAGAGGHRESAPGEQKGEPQSGAAGDFPATEAGGESMESSQCAAPPPTGLYIPGAHVQGPRPTPCPAGTDRQTPHRHTPRPPQPLPASPAPEAGRAWSLWKHQVEKQRREQALKELLSPQASEHGETELMPSALLKKLPPPSRSGFSWLLSEELRRGPQAGWEGVPQGHCSHCNAFLEQLRKVLQGWEPSSKPPEEKPQPLRQLQKVLEGPNKHVPKGARAPRNDLKDMERVRQQHRLVTEELQDLFGEKRERTVRAAQPPREWPEGSSGDPGAKKPPVEQVN